MSRFNTTGDHIEFQCRHIFTDGRRCASPTLRSPNGHEPFCYYHHTHRRPVLPADRAPLRRRTAAKAGFTLPLPEDRSSIQHSIGEVLRRIAANEIDSRRAGLLLYGLQIASLNLKKDPKNAKADPDDLVTEITHDPDHGLLAPPAELGANKPMGSAQRLLLELGWDDEDDVLPSPQQPRTSPQSSSEPTPQSTSPAPPPNLAVDLQACAVSRDTQRTPGSPANLFAGVGTRSLGWSRETIFRMSNFIPKPATPKLSGLGPKAQRLAALREKAAAQANSTSNHATDSAAAAKPKNSVAKKTAFQRKAT